MRDDTLKNNDDAMPNGAFLPAPFIPFSKCVRRGKNHGGEVKKAGAENIIDGVTVYNIAEGIPVRDFFDGEKVKEIPDFPEIRPGADASDLIAEKPPRPSKKRDDYRGAKWLGFKAGEGRGGKPDVFLLNSSKSKDGQSKAHKKLNSVIYANSKPRQDYKPGEGKANKVSHVKICPRERYVIGADGRAVLSDYVKEQAAIASGNGKKRGTRVVTPKKSKLRYICMLSAEVAFVICVCVFMLAPLTKPRAEVILSDAPATAAQPEPTPQPEQPEPTQTPEPQPTPTMRSMLPQMAELYMKNRDTAGWIKIDGTKVDYPVMYRPEDEAYYLYKTFDKMYDPTRQGCIYISESNILEPRDTNLLIHGHNMKNGSMFHTLEKYKSEDYFKEHPVIEYMSLYEKGEYEIFAAFASKIFDEDETSEFEYYKFLNPESKAEFDSGISAIKDMALYETGITPRYGDELITLSTCEYSRDSGRMVVMARRVK